MKLKNRPIFLFRTGFYENSKEFFFKSESKVPPIFFHDFFFRTQKLPIFISNLYNRLTNLLLIFFTKVYCVGNWVSSSRMHNEYWGNLKYKMCVSILSLIWEHPLVLKHKIAAYATILNTLVFAKLQSSTWYIYVPCGSLKLYILTYAHILKAQSKQICESHLLF